MIKSLYVCVPFCSNKNICPTNEMWKDDSSPFSDYIMIDKKTEEEKFFKYIIMTDFYLGDEKFNNMKDIPS
jgi:hypothetical protein